ncbi:phosphotransferase [Colwellia sp. 6_MG-2023]|jgi:thiamine kinase-like enzyme|uniref:phosphotransferase n=1 Tax=Colwellia sp. 6_MG-2023 TaxID=3062676 RepID=UPI0026E1F978|nr:phosphotransferase [Colwellia sp. 6_MG-2023]MDO6486244.1 phosphotransferase [Colwellia sp. 6_MG-2023]
MLPPLSTLACFKTVDAIVPITAGLSSQCYQVFADNKCFFAKQVTTTDEPLVNIYAASKNISPSVIYHDNHWLITEFIAGDNLSLAQETLDKKIMLATKLMAQCHQLKVNVNKQVPENVIGSFMNEQAFLAQQFSTQQQNALLRCSKDIITSLNATADTTSKGHTNLVCCHGDINFSNIVLSLDQTAYLVDYECVCLAPAEYDLAMLVAVNNLNEDKLSLVIKLYQKHIHGDINQTRVKDYLQFCYFINGLWYAQAYNKSNLEQFVHLAKQQWQHLPFQQNLFFNI